VRPPSLQAQSILDAFGQYGWQAERIENREVIQTIFEAHHSRIHLLAQAFPEMNALAIVAETPAELKNTHLALGLELIMHANKQLTLGNFEYDIDRHQLVFRATNLFDREKYDAPIISSLVHCAIAELDRLTPYIGVIIQTPPDLLKDLSPRRLLEREDLIPPVPGAEEGHLDTLDDFDPLDIAHDVPEQQASSQIEISSTGGTEEEEL